jgi:hypothetical protein
MKKYMSDIWEKLIFILTNIIKIKGKINFIKKQIWKSFYIMKVIYINIIYRLLSINVRNVQQSLYMGKSKYILKL